MPNDVGYTVGSIEEFLPGESGGLPATLPWNPARPYGEQAGAWNPG